MREISEEELVASLTHHASLDDFVLFGPEGERLSVCIAHPKGGLSMLLIEEEDAKEAAVVFLKKRGARYFESPEEYRKATGWDGIARVEPMT